MVSQEHLCSWPPFGRPSDREWRSHGKPRVPLSVATFRSAGWDVKPARNVKENCDSYCMRCLVKTSLAKTLLREKMP